MTFQLPDHLPYALTSGTGHVQRYPECARQRQIPGTLVPLLGARQGRRYARPPLDDWCFQRRSVFRHWCVFSHERRYAIFSSVIAEEKSSMLLVMRVLSIVPLGFKVRYLLDYTSAGRLLTRLRPKHGQLRYRENCWSSTHSCGRLRVLCGRCWRRLR